MELDYLNDPEFQELIRNYLDYLSSSLPTVKENLTNENIEQVQKFGHNLKGSGGGYGFNDFSELGGKIESSAMQKDIESLNSLIVQFETLLKEKLSQLTS